MWEGLAQGLQGLGFRAHGCNGYSEAFGAFPVRLRLAVEA